MAKPDLMDRPVMSTVPALYACFDVREFPLQALLRGRPGKRPVAVLEGKPPLERVCSVNDHARTLGLQWGMTRVEVETFPGVVALSRSYAEELETKTELLECAGRFSPRIEDQSSDGRFTAVLDIAGTTRLFGEPQQLGKKLLQAAHALGIHGVVVIGSNLPATICLARGMEISSGVLVVPSGGEMSALRPMPLAILGLSAEHARTFSSWGITTVGELAELPEIELIARLGQEGRRLRQLARGESPHLFTPVEPVRPLEENMELDTPVEAFASLLFILAAMLDRLIAQAKSNLLALASITLHARLEGGAVHTRAVRPALPSNDRQLWLKLLDLDLQAHPPEAAVVSLCLTAQCGSTSKMQLGLFCPQEPEPMRLEVTLARIRSIVGEERVGRAVLKDTHRPDAFSMEPFVVPAALEEDGRPIGLCTALRQIRPPEKITVGLRHHCPNTLVFRQKRYTVERAYGPWFSAGDWWNADLWSLEQWDLIAREQTADEISRPNGSKSPLLYCCLTHDLIRKCWQMTALYD
ncbi:MAG TPA: DNA polymerase Y family protein [Acidobacteriaceae bacterium]|nr:DNA polymerase Y family protein [Acidobacteriaceae bacterium]